MKEISRSVLIKKKLRTHYKKINKEKIGSIRNTRRIKTARNSNNFIHSFLIFLLWGMLLMIIIFVDPEIYFVVPIFLSLLFLALITTCNKYFEKNTSFLISTGAIFFLLLSLFGLGNFLNFLLIAGVASSIWYYQSK